MATLRQARGTSYPDPVLGAQLAAKAGADGITIHLREDRRHIIDDDLARMMVEQELPVNLEMANTEEMVAIALRTKPAEVCLVPEKREELTTEGGLEVVGQLKAVTQTVNTLQDAGIRVSLFIDPDQAQIDASKQSGASMIELHTGCYADAVDKKTRESELKRIQEGSRHGHDIGLQVNAGHGLHYQNVTEVASIPEIVCLNIGHSIIARAVMTGLDEAVRTMKLLMVEARG